MMEKLSEYLVNNLLNKDEKLDENQMDIMLFGMTRILEDIPKFTGIFFLCYLLGILKELVVVVIITMIYKMFVGGAHARTNLGCFLVSSIYFIFPIMLAKYIIYDLKIYYVIYLITIIYSIYVIIKIAPADTEEIPIINRRKRKKFKICALISLFIIIFLTIFFINNLTYMKIIMYTILFVNLFTMPFMYKLLKCKLGIESDEFKQFY